MKTKLLYKDKAGNKLYERYIKSRKKYQMFAKNRQGRLVREKDVLYLAKKAGYSMKRIKGGIR